MSWTLPPANQRDSPTTGLPAAHRTRQGWSAHHSHCTGQGYTHPVVPVGCRVVEGVPPAQHNCTHTTWADESKGKGRTDKGLHPAPPWTTLDGRVPDNAVCMVELIYTAAGAAKQHTQGCGTPHTVHQHAKRQQAAPHRTCGCAHATAGTHQDASTVSAGRLLQPPPGNTAPSPAPAAPAARTQGRKQVA